MSDSPQLDYAHTRCAACPGGWVSPFIEPILHGGAQKQGQARGTEYRQLLHGSRGGFESLTGHYTRCASPIGRGICFKNRPVRVRVSRAALHRARRSTVEAADLSPVQCGFESRRAHAAVAQRQEAPDSGSGQCGFESRSQHRKLFSSE